MWAISILADFRPMGHKFHAAVVFDLGKNLLFKSVLEHCAMCSNSTCSCFCVMVISIRAEHLKFCQSKQQRSICFHRISRHETPVRLLLNEY